MFDSHMHTPLCKHASGTPMEYAQAALDAGLTGITFTDHMPMPEWYDAPWRMHLSELDRYIEWVQEAQQAFEGRLDIRLGLEGDYHPGTERYVEKVLDRHPWDYVIGSIHYLGAWGFDNPEFIAEYDNRDLTGLYQQYYQLATQAAKSGLFDSIGHLDLPKKFGHLQPDPSLAFEALDAVAAAGMALDYNTAGYRKPVKEAYPSNSLVLEAVKRGIPFVLGSDAHKPEEVGHRFAEAVQDLEKMGAKVVSFRGRQQV
ncbi:histidinol-phosphatase HisJ [Deinococcus cellulosilyticus]|uniref:Histidinol-phosphatase n=1 Tax=Deinococcus cellulosilyticus (strain DSM 18568 / NBRC 106333 / KACC 11606 / 5516J-15) TaxID=1223518 RepID=A0A511N3S2_DEIC1|nr:histidinol-phosphatase HisJ [Deinococcus cellulosilyticus]GEM47118.1 putative histidinol-phosphatase [Deinococcus cellulosilyticus NBRC 106333 = KACC 11606]